ncbi:MAG: hypothetical protein KatS3mg008_0733 [Acidimicrobiales bacterium]|nr:MAG: hypothetical protein KatS3mg008_0733 [Acidimicrobiales bacterium]
MYSVAFLVLAVACAERGADDARTSPGEGSESGSANATATTSADGATAAGSGSDGGSAAVSNRLKDLSLRPRVVARVDSPIAMVHHPLSGDLYVAGRRGLVWLLEEGGRPRQVLDIRGDTTTEFERGLLSLAIAPDGRHLYVSYTDLRGDSKIDAYRLEDGVPVPETRREILSVEQPFPNHNGGHVVFGPDGAMWFGLGDGGGAGDPLETGQDPGDLLGSLLRIRPTPEGPRPYEIPADNPFVGDGAGDARPEVFLYGLRNPWRFSFDRQTRDLWIGDVGQSSYEEIDLLPAANRWRAGGNLGWASMEGLHPFEGDAEPAGHIRPVYEYRRIDGACAVTGGHVYRGRAIPELRGVYVFGDFCDGVLRYLIPIEEGIVAGTIDGLRLPPENLASFAEDEDGELYLLALKAGTVLRLEASRP